MVSHLQSEHANLDRLPTYQIRALGLVLAGWGFISDGDLYAAIHLFNGV
jgi:hypothetical protein